MSLEELTKTRSQIKAALTRYKTFVDKVVANNMIRGLQQRLADAKMLLVQFNDVQAKIENISNIENDMVTREDFEDKYYEVITISEELIEKHYANRCHNLIPNVNSIANSGHNTNQTVVPLPFIDLPKFSGIYTEWLSFFNRFNSIIHNNSRLDDAQKMYYLQGSLTGDAKRYIDTLPEAEGSYQKAWQMLEERFKSTRLTVQNHVFQLFNLKTANLKSCRKSLRELLDEFSVNLAALETPSLNVNFKDTLLIFLLSSRVDYATKNEWESKLKANELPTLEDFINFLKHRCQTIEAIEANPLNNTQYNYGKSNSNHDSSRPEAKRQYVTNNQNSSCVLCKQNHYLPQCAEFLKLSINDRMQQIKKFKLCFNCLKPGHDNKQCRASTCRTCSHKHNTLLHYNNSRPGNNIQSQSNIIQAQDLQVRQVNSDVEVLLSTALVECMDNDGNTRICKILLDPGSQQNLITQNLCKKLKLNIESTTLGISGACKAYTQINQCCHLKFKSMQNNYTQQIKCLVVPVINEDFPAESFDKTDIPIPENINLADPHFNISSPIDVLIGAGLFWNLLEDGRIKAKNKQTTLQNTKLGWILGGPFITAAIQVNDKICNNLQNSNYKLSNVELENQITKFWEIESYSENENLTKDEKFCEEFFNSTYKRDEHGRFIVRLPFKQSNPNPLITEYGEIAFKRFRALENKFTRNPDFKAEYCKFMEDYIKLNHMQLVSDYNAENSIVGCFLPHHGVVKENNLSTKVRAVFDASCKTISGISLNDYLLPGPNLQKELFVLLIKFRQYQFVLSADIIKMFRQIWISSEDKKYLQILWRSSTDEPIKIYNLNTVTYGTICAPYLAMKSLKTLGLEFKNSLPEASRAIREDFYMDDLITGANSAQDATKLKNDIIDILKSGGFELAKWASNNTDLLPNNTDNTNNSTIIRLDSNMKTKTLGLVWNCEQDTISYDIKIKDQSIINKRFVLSVIATIYDPIGLLNPLILTAKLILQKLWQLKVDWDDNLPLELHKKFQSFLTDLPNINQIVIPRKIIQTYPYEKIELHGFSDASTQAYGAAIYIKVTDTDNKNTINLICAKGRIAPLKEITIPRLELCAAVLLANLITKISKTLNINMNDCYMWTDSTITLAWIASSPQRWQSFVRNRVIEIQSLSETSQWRHVRSADNPADILSRGATVNELKDSKLWWNGPSFLSQNIENWPTFNINKSIEIPETRKIIINTISTTDKFSVINKFSSYKKLKRVIGYCIRFCNNCRTKNYRSSVNNSDTSLNLTVAELEEAEMKIVKLIQQETFENEIHDLKSNKEISNKSNLKALNVFLDKNEILRVGGRLQNSNLHFDSKHPILLPKSHKITKLIVHDTHEKELHAGVHATLAAVRRKYWPIAGRNAVREVIHKCIRCYRTHPKPYEELMGNLPTVRVTPTRPFLKCGVDYAGPLTLKLERGRSKKTVKSYVIVFVCLATKAIHLELTFDYTAESFLNALKRMMARRGKVSHLYSDNGTNFVGANHELEKIRNILLSESFNSSIIAPLINEGIKWKFIPPRSPYVGGIWEAGVKSFKQHFKKVTGSVLITVEEMHTLLTLIESCLNSRPLTPISNDPNDLEALTPGHFLIGGAITAPLEPHLVEIQDNRLSRWQRVEKLRQLFWERWQKEYLTELQRRNKWHKQSDVPIRVGTMVVLRDEILPPLQWKLGRVTELHPGKDGDGIVRVVTIKTATSTTKRGVNRLCVLPIEQ